MKFAKRIETLPPYLFAEIDKRIAEKRAAGVDVISFGVGDPDRPTPPHIVEAMKRALDDVSTHQYPSYYGMPEFRQAVARFYKRRFGVDLDPDAEVQPLIGSKEGIANLATAIIDPGDRALVCDPGYPVYAIGTHLAGGKTKSVKLTPRNGFMPKWDTLKVPQRTKLMWINYPGNPTAATAELSDFENAVAFAKGHELLLAHDAAYTELTYDGYVAPSILQAPGAKDVAIEFHSMSKTYNMTGWRIGFAVGNARAIEALGRVKTNIDSGIFNAIQLAGIAALDGPQDFLDELRAIYKRRRDLAVKALKQAGLRAKKPRGSIYLWVPVPKGHDSASFATLLLDEAGVVVPPGAGYGAAGEGFVRFSLTVPDERFEEGLERIRTALG